MANENIPNPQEEKDQISQMLVDTGNTILEHQEEEKAFRKHQQIEAEMIHQKYGDRIMKDEGLRAAFDSSIGTGADQSLGQAFLDPIHKYVRELHKDYIKFVKKEDSENRDKAFAKLKLLKQEVAAIKEMKRDYSDNMMGGEVGQPTISKGCSQQQVSIADQLYTQNPELRVEIGTKKHVRAEMVDFYNEPLRQGECYGVVQDFAGNETYVNFKNGNKNLYVPPMEKSIEYQELKKEQTEIAKSVGEQISGGATVLGNANAANAYIDDDGNWNLQKGGTLVQQISKYNPNVNQMLMNHLTGTIDKYGAPEVQGFGQGWTGGTTMQANFPKTEIKSRIEE